MQNAKSRRIGRALAHPPVTTATRTPRRRHTSPRRADPAPANPRPMQERCPRIDRSPPRSDPRSTPAPRTTGDSRSASQSKSPVRTAQTAFRLGAFRPGNTYTDSQRTRGCPTAAMTTRLGAYVRPAAKGPTPTPDPDLSNLHGLREQNHPAILRLSPRLSTRSPQIMPRRLAPETAPRYPPVRHSPPPSRGRQNTYIFMQNTLPPDFMYSDVSTSITFSPRFRNASTVRGLSF